MAARIEERFTVQAPAERVWGYLLDPRQVVGCLAGARITEAVDERTFRGSMTVKVGPATVAYQGSVVLSLIDAAAMRVTMTGEGRESSGSARMTMDSRLVALPGGGTEVTVIAEVDLTGRLVQLGRGMVEQVSHQMFQEFARCVQARLEAVPGTAPAAETGRPLRAVPLLARALWAWLLAFLRRLLGRR